MRLHFRRLSGDYYWANADGSAGRQYGQPGYEVRLIKGAWRAIGPSVHDASMVILGEGLSRTDAMAVCEADVPKYERALTGAGE